MDGLVLFGNKLLDSFGLSWYSWLNVTLQIKQNWFWPWVKASAEKCYFNLLVKGCGNICAHRSLWIFKPFRVEFFREEYIKMSSWIIIWKYISSVPKHVPFKLYNLFSLNGVPFKLNSWLLLFYLYLCSSTFLNSLVLLARWAYFVFEFHWLWNEPGIWTLAYLDLYSYPSLWQPKGLSRLS